MQQKRSVFVFAINLCLSLANISLFRLQDAVHRLGDGDVLCIKEVRVCVHCHADLTVTEPVLRGFGAQDALQQRRLGVTQFVQGAAFAALASCDHLAVHLVGAHILGVSAETVIDGEVAPPAPVVRLVDEIAQLVVEHRRALRLLLTGGL